MPAQEHKVFQPPKDPDTPIWRYMDFTKFVSMLENKGLFFSRSDKLGDPFEGSFSRGNKQLRPLMYKDTGIPLSAFETISNITCSIRPWTFVNCWHMNTHESAAMWKLYAKTNEAIAIRSTYKQLRECIDSDCYLGVVHYIDYESAWLPEGNALSPYVHKHLSFAHEQELRAVIQKSPRKDNKIDYSQKPPDGGVWKSVDTDELINAIYVAPMSPSWYRELVEQVLRRYGISKTVIQSSLDHEPFF